MKAIARIRKIRYTNTENFKLTDRQYETYRRFSKYFGSNEPINKWGDDLDRIEKEKGKDLQNIELEIKNGHLNKG